MSCQTSYSSTSRATPCVVGDGRRPKLEADGECNAPGEEPLETYAAYEDYLDAHISDADRFYLQEDELARQLVELGCRKGDMLSREEFNSRREIAEQQRRAKLENSPCRLVSEGKDWTAFPFLDQLAKREEHVRSGRLATIIFIRDRNAKGQELSGYIDYAQRLKTDDFEAYFTRGKKFLPRPTDLSFCKWETNYCISNDSPAFSVVSDPELGLLFKHKRDSKVINVDPTADSKEEYTRQELKTREYVQVVFYDHLIRTR